MSRDELALVGFEGGKLEIEEIFPKSVPVGVRWQASIKTNNTFEIRFFCFFIIVVHFVFILHQFILVCILKN